MVIAYFRNTEEVHHGVSFSYLLECYKAISIILHVRQNHTVLEIRMLITKITNNIICSMSLSAVPLIKSETSCSYRVANK